MRLIKFSLISVLIISLVITYSYKIEPNQLIVRKQNHTLNSKIVIFSDTHFSNNYSYKNIDKITTKINEQNPDIILFLGDFLDSSFKLSDESSNYLSNSLGKMHAKYGKYAILGNHDYRFNINKLNTIFSDGDFQLLINDTITINELSLNIIGLDDILYGNPNNDLVTNTSNQSDNILLVHEPDYVDELDLTNINYVFSGHSHGGQIFVPFLNKVALPRGAKNYQNGFYSLGKKTQLYVTSGIGTSILPLRFLNLPEIVVFTASEE